MVSICVEIRAYRELLETERTQAKNVWRGERTWAGVSFWVWDFQRPGRGCYARSIHCTGDCKALREKEGGRAMGTHFSQTHPVLQKHSRPYLAPLGAVTHTFFCGHTLNKREKGSFNGQSCANSWCIISSQEYFASLSFLQTPTKRL